MRGLSLTCLFAMSLGLSVSCAHRNPSVEIPVERTSPAIAVPSTWRLWSTIPSESDSAAPVSEKSSRLRCVSVMAPSS